MHNCAMAPRRRPKGQGTVTRFRSGFRAKLTLNGRDVYGTPRTTWAEADSDRAALAKGALPRTDCPTFAEWAYEQSLGSYGRSLAPSTLETNETCRLKFIEGQSLGQMKLTQITSHVLRHWFSEMKSERRRKVNGVITVTLVPASPRYKHRIKGYFSKLFSLAIEEEILQTNPCRSVKIPTINERENTLLAPAEIGSFVSGSSRIDGIALLCSLCGLRPTEARLLKWDQLDRAGRQILHPGTKNETARKPVPLPDEVLRVLDLQPQRAPEIFTTQEGRPLTKERLRADWHKRKEELGMPVALRLQDLRGTYVTLLIQSGADLRTTMELARHATPAITLKAYARADDGRRRAAQAAVVASITVTSNGHKAPEPGSFEPGPSGAMTL
jgi:integrase